MRLVAQERFGGSQPPERKEVQRPRMKIIKSKVQPKWKLK